MFTCEAALLKQSFRLGVYERTALPAATLAAHYIFIYTLLIIYHFCV